MHPLRRHQNGLKRPRDSRKLLIGLGAGVILFGLLDLDRPRTARRHAH
jgi:hypothetical protein